MLENMNRQELIELIEKLEKENKELKEKIYGKQPEKIKIESNKAISNEEKIKIFMNVFKGRTDVFAKRYISKKNGKAGYTPVCKNEFNKFHLKLKMQNID